jgi:xanthine/uracil/vitamin C permease (AzgA family)
MLEQMFALRARGATVGTEVLAGATTFIVVGYLMCGIMREIPFSDFEEGFPALATIVAMPLTYSITNGIGIGMLLYAFIKLVRGKAHELSPHSASWRSRSWCTLSSHGSCRFWPFNVSLL